MRKIIFHHPMPLNPNATSASGIRPVKMLQAFRDSGYEVTEITGYSYERKKKITTLKKRIRSGEIFDFVYSESSTQPTLLTDPDHIPRALFQDFILFRFCQSAGIPVGLFYRDIYWRFFSYYKVLGFIKGFVGSFFYILDLFFYRWFVDRIYLPSMQMGDYIPVLDRKTFMALPPGCSFPTSPQLEKIDNIIRILYVGGIGSHYRMELLFQSVSGLEGVHLTVCCREDDWLKVSDRYSCLVSPNIKIIHESGDGLLKYYQSCDILSLCVEPVDYWEFAMPMKLFDYIGVGKPILSTRNTLVGEFVTHNDIGWSVDYKLNEIRNFLIGIRSNSLMIEEKKNSVARKRDENAWTARANFVVDDMKNFREL